MLTRPTRPWSTTTGCPAHAAEESTQQQSHLTMGPGWLPIRALVPCNKSSPQPAWRATGYPPCIVPKRKPLAAAKTVISKPTAINATQEPLESARSLVAAADSCAATVLTQSSSQDVQKARKTVLQRTTQCVLRSARADAIASRMCATPRSTGTAFVSISTSGSIRVSWRGHRS